MNEKDLRPPVWVGHVVLETIRTSVSPRSVSPLRRLRSWHPSITSSSGSGSRPAISSRSIQTMSRDPCDIFMRLSIAFLILCLASTAAQGQERLSGNWRGYWSQAGDSMLVVLDVQHDPKTDRYTAAFSSDRLRVRGIPFAEVRVQGCCDVTMVLRGDRTTTEFTGTLKGDSLSGVFREDANTGRFAYSRIPKTAPSYEERSVTFSNGPVTLAGSLLLPLNGDSLTALVFLQGSGAEGRWASRFPAAQMATRGIAALIFMGISVMVGLAPTPEE